MSPPVVNSYSPQQNNLCDQNQVTSTLDNQSTELQQNPMSPMPPQAQPVQPQQQQQQSQPTQQQSSQNQLNEMPNMVDPINVGLQSQMVDPMNPYRRSGKLHFTFHAS